MRTIPVALQLYTVRDMMQKDVPETLRAVKAIGYDYVEPAGLFGMSADAFRKALDDAGLTAVCAHVPLAEMSADTEKFISVYKTIGCKYVAVPYLPEEQRYGTPAFEATLAEIARIADDVNSSAENIGARRLHTILEKVLEDVAFSAPEASDAVVVDAAYVKERLAGVIARSDFSDYVL